LACGILSAAVRAAGPTLEATASTRSGAARAMRDTTAPGSERRQNQRKCRGALPRSTTLDCSHRSIPTLVRVAQARVARVAPFEVHTHHSIQGSRTQQPFHGRRRFPGTKALNIPSLAGPPKRPAPTRPSGAWPLEPASGRVASARVRADPQAWPAPPPLAGRAGAAHGALSSRWRWRDAVARERDHSWRDW
jgi:hypothetical protein